MENNKDHKASLQVMQLSQKQWFQSAFPPTASKTSASAGLVSAGKLYSLTCFLRSHPHKCTPAFAITSNGYYYIREELIKVTYWFWQLDACGLQINISTEKLSTMQSSGIAREVLQLVHFLYAPRLWPTTGTRETKVCSVTNVSKTRWKTILC